MEDLQRAVLDYCRERRVQKLAPNIHLLMGCEQDMLEVTQAGYAVEYECKTNQSDFRADFRKTCGWRTKKHDLLAGKVDPGLFTLPRRFWFVLPTFMVTSSKHLDWYEQGVPAHAGILAASYRKVRYAGQHEVELTILRPAPVIRGAKKLTEKQLGRILTSLAWRHWDLWLANEARREVSL